MNHSKRNCEEVFHIQEVFIIVFVGYELYVCLLSYTLILTIGSFRHNIILELVKLFIPSNGKNSLENQRL